MAQIEVTEESLRTAVDEEVFAQAVVLAGKVAAFSAVGPQIEAIVDGTEVSVRVGPFGLDARCACPAAPYPETGPCPHAVAAVLTWVRAGPDPAAGLRAGLDDVLAGLARRPATVTRTTAGIRTPASWKISSTKWTTWLARHPTPRASWPGTRPPGSGRCWPRGTA